MQIGIIGFGRMGQLITRFLSQDAKCLIYDIKKNDQAILDAGGTPATLAELASSHMIIAAVPISEMVSSLNAIAPLLIKETLFIDVCSVKTYPIQWMKEILPSHVEILGTHPMFGPDSAKTTLYGKKMVLCPVRIAEKKVINIKNYLESMGLYVINSSAEDHDKQIAETLVLTHYIGRGLIDFQAESKEIDTLGHRRLMKILETVENDSWQLFVDMNQYNPYAEQVRQKFTESLKNVQESLP